MRNETEMDELQIIINHHSILQQKVSVLFAVNTILIGSFLTLSVTVSLWFIVATLFSLISILFNVYILYPNFNSGKETKYFYDFAQMNSNEIKEYLSGESYNDNYYYQIQINSKILREKYNLFKHSLAIQFFFIPYIISFLNKLKERNK